MRNSGYFQFRVKKEQIEYAKSLADSSMNHPITDIYKNDVPTSYGKSGDERSWENRFVGSLGEILYADVYGTPRPRKAFGAIDGQDYGCDNIMEVNGKEYRVDIKTQIRNNVYLCEYYALNLQDYQIKKTTKRMHILISL